MIEAAYVQQKNRQKKHVERSYYHIIYEITLLNSFSVTDENDVARPKCPK